MWKWMKRISVIEHEYFIFSFLLFLGFFFERLEYYHFPVMENPEYVVERKTVARNQSVN